MNWRVLGKRIWRNRFHFLVLAVAVLIADLGLRVVFPEPTSTYFFARGKGLWAEDRELFWVPHDRFEDQLETMEKTASDRLVLGFGGSVVTDDKASTNFLRLLGDCLGDPFVVANFGTGGYTSHQSLILFKRMVELKKPRFAVVCHGFNDMSNAPASDARMAERNARFSTNVLYYLTKSKIVAVFRRVLWKARGYDPYDEKNFEHFERRVQVPEFKANLDGFARVAREKEFPLVLVSQANPDRAIVDALTPYFAEMERVAKSNPHVYYLDVKPTILGMYEEKFGGIPEHIQSGVSRYLYMDLCHLNDRGHHIVADLLCDFVKDLGLTGDEPKKAAAPAG